MIDSIRTLLKELKKEKVKDFVIYINDGYEEYTGSGIISNDRYFIVDVWGDSYYLGDINFDVIQTVISNKKIIYERKG